MLPVIALLAAFSAFTAIYASMKKHEKEVWNAPPAVPVVKGLRVVACALLVLAWICCALYWGAPMGTAAWVCCVVLAPVVLVFMLSYVPTRATAKTGAVAGVITALLSVIVLIPS